MRFNGENLFEVLDAHARYIECPENDEDRADFSNMNLDGIVLAHINLSAADFRNTSLICADLSFSDLTRADFTGAKFFETALFHTTLRGAFGVPYFPQNVPDTGSFIAWKRVKLQAGGDHYAHSAIAKLRIPGDARRVSLLNGEYKASKAEVLEIQSLDGSTLPDAVAVSIKDIRTEYRPGDTITVSNFDSDIYSEHTPGIFFYLDRRRAVEYLCSGKDDENGTPVPLDFKEVEDELKESGMYGTPPNVFDYLINDDLINLAFAIKHLSEKEAALAVLKYWDRFPLEVIAERLELSPEDTLQLKQSLEAKLEKALQPEPETP